MKKQDILGCFFCVIGVGNELGYRHWVVMILENPCILREVEIFHRVFEVWFLLDVNTNYSEVMWTKVILDEGNICKAVAFCKIFANLIVFFIFLSCVTLLSFHMCGCFFFLWVQKK